MTLSRMQQRRGTAAQWAVTNPVLEAGELGFESDTTNLKIGDGATSWNDLPYVAEGIAGPQGEPGIQGATGATGPAGAQGPQGDEGDPGADGANGLSAYEVAVLNGFVGTQEEWLLSLAGEDGDPILSINQQSASYTAQLSDAGKLIEINSSSATTFSIPTDESVTFVTGTQISILQTGSGQITVSASNPVTTTINGTPGTKLRTQWSSATLIKRGANLWVITGDLTS
jgi:hypothetical protein